MSASWNEAIDAPYCGPAPQPAEVLLAWNTDWRVLAVLALLACATACLPRRGWFAGGWLALVVAFVSPLCALTTALVAARTAHHLVLLVVAAPLLGLALVPWARRLPAHAGHSALLAVLAVLALWHVPAVYTLAWHSHAVYALLQLGLLLPAVVLWMRAAALWQGQAPLADTPTVLAHLAVLAGAMGLIGAVLTFAPQALYREHGLTALAYGLDPLSDQQLAGLLMWVPGFVPVVAMAAAVLQRSWQRAAPAGPARAWASGAAFAAAAGRPAATAERGVHRGVDQAGERSAEVGAS